MQLKVTAGRRIEAPAELVYRILADYAEHHPRILPPAFSDLRVEAGGIGAGTRISFSLTLGGRTRRFSSEISEPHPGSVLVEADATAGTRSTFTVTAAGGAAETSIETAWPASTGVAGMLERLLAPRMMRSLLTDELRRLEEYARSLA